MSSIDQQIKALQLKKKKIDYLNYIADLIKNDTKCLDFKDVQKEVVDKFEPFILQLMDSIEKDTTLLLQDVGAFSAEEMSVLKILAQKALTKNITSATGSVTPNNGAFGTDTPGQPPQKKPDQRILSNHDKMNFAMDNRHLGNKRVQVLNDQNSPIFGIVVGLDAPNVVVKTETGPTINVPLEKIVPV
jgi:hypothetical protein